MECHWILGLVALTTAALLWREVYSIACLSSKRLDNDNGVNGLEDCTNIEECAPDEVCYVEKFVTENNPSAMKYRAGCRNIRDCKLISCSNEVTESVPTPRVGKRYVDEISLCAECCYNDTCNTQGCGSNALDPVRAKYHKKCFNCQHIKEDDHSTCTQMVWCEQPTQVCGISADPFRREYNLKCEFKKLCDQALIASNQSGAPLLLKCFDGHLQNYNPLSNHTATVVADILPCPTGLVPTTPTTTTQKTTTTATTTTTTAQKTTTSTTTTPMTPKTTTKASTIPRVTTSKTSPTTKSTTQLPTVVTSPKTTPTVSMTSTTKITTPSPTPTTVKVTTTIKQPTLKTTITPSTTPKRPTLPPLTVTTTLAPTSPNTNSPSLPPVNPTIPIATKVVTMAPVTTTTKALPITTTTTPKPTTTTTTPKPMTTTTSPKPTTTTTTPKPTTTTTTPKPITTTTTPKPTTTTTTPKPTTTTTTPKPTTTTTTPKPTTTTTTPKPTTTTTTPKPTTTSTPKPTTTMKTTTRMPTTPTTTELKTTTKVGPPAGHTIPPNPTVCFVCMDDAPDLCVDLYDEKSCEPPNNYCINQVTNYADGNKFVNRTCGNFDRCFKDWYHGSSDTDVCQTFDENQYITLDFECVYCCVKDRCNMQMKPPADTLYEDK